MRSAYIYAERGGQPPKEIILLGYLDRFGGAINVLGRPLGAKEIRAMVTAENVVNAYRARAKSDNWAVWAQKNKQAAGLLERAMIAVGEGEDGASND